MIRPAGIARYHLLDGERDPDEVCRQVGARLRKEAVDVAFAGIGENGHLAFNDPPADFDTDEPYLVVRLDERCRRQQVGEGWFASIDDVPDDGDLDVDTPDPAARARSSASCRIDGRQKRCVTPSRADRSDGAGVDAAASPGHVDLSRSRIGVAAAERNMKMRTFPILLALVLLVHGGAGGARSSTPTGCGSRSSATNRSSCDRSAPRPWSAIVAGVVVFALLAGNLLLALRALRPRPFLVSTPHGPQTIMVDPSSIRPIALGAVALVSLLIANYAGSQWETWLYFLNATPFGKTDPILGRDIGFYVFTLPLLEMIQGMLFFVLFLMADRRGRGVRRSARSSGSTRTRRIFVSRRAGRHLGLLAALVLLVLAFGAWLQIPQLLTDAVRRRHRARPTPTSTRGSRRCGRSPAPASLGAVLAVWQALRGGRLWPIARGGALYVVVSIGGSAYAAIIQRFVVAPERAGERDAVHRPQHPGDARRVRPRRRDRAAAVG